MSRQVLNHARLNIVESGEGSETLVFLHGLLFSHRMFEAQVAALQFRFRCIRMDFRGQGDSEVTRSGYDLETLADDAIALIEHLDCGPVHLLGFSMGGMVAAAGGAEAARSAAFAGADEHFGRTRTMAQTPAFRAAEPGRAVPGAGQGGPQDPAALVL